MPNPFLPTAQAMLADPATPPLTRHALNYLISNGHVGHRNPVPLDRIVSWLVDQGHITVARSRARRHFQHTVLVPSRQSRLFIGTYGDFRGGGIFLIENLNDAKETFEFYDKRIRKERKHLANLRALMTEAF